MIPRTRFGRAHLWVCAAVLVLASTVARGDEGVPKNWQIDHSEITESIDGVEHLVVTNTLGTVRLNSGAKNIDGQMLAQSATADPRTIEADVRRDGATLHLDVVLRGDAPDEEPELWTRRQVDLALAIPPGLAVTVTTVDGGVETKGLDAPLHVTTGDGEVIIRGSHAAKVVTAQGSVRMIARDQQRGGEIHLESTNGDVRLDLMETSTGAVDVSTRGAITTDYSIDIKSRPGGTHKTGRIEFGGEGPAVRLESANGAIRVGRLIDMERGAS
ncbi:MAG: hypothetical protein AAGF23_07210 [Acidobacteriota bacterium]